MEWSSRESMIKENIRPSEKMYKVNGFFIAIKPNPKEKC